jgi:hypothetical protein
LSIIVVTVVRFSNNYYEGLTADTKPTNVPAGATFRDTQLDIIYEFNGSTWDIIIGNTKTETLSNKTINPTSNVLPFLSSFTYTIYLDGGVVKSRNNKTGAVASNANIDTPLWDALTGGDPSVEVLPGTYNTHSTFGGWTIASYTHLYMHPGVNINVPQGYTGGVFVIGNGSSTIQYAQLEGGRFDEQGTPAFGWDLIKIAPTLNKGVASCQFRNMIAFHANIVIHCLTVGAATPDDNSSWIEGNYFDNIQGESCKNLMYPEHSGTWWVGVSGANRGTYVNCYLHSDWSNNPDPDSGVTVIGEQEKFFGCGAYDLWNNVNAPSIYITSTAKHTLIIGGFLTHQFPPGDTFADWDLGEDTMVWDRYQGFYNKNPTHFYDTVDMHSASLQNAVIHSSVTGIVNANIAAGAAIAYSKLNLGTSIVNADISASAAIATSKLADGASFVTLTGTQTLSNKTMDGVDIRKTAGAGFEEVWSATMAGVTDDIFTLANGSGTAGQFNPIFRSFARVVDGGGFGHFRVPLYFQSICRSDDDDSGGEPLIIFGGMSSDGTNHDISIVNRPLVAFANSDGFDRIFQVWPTYVELGDARNIKVGSTTGTKIGTAASEKIAFHNATPVVQASFIAAPTGGATTDTEARTAIDAIRTLLINKGLMAAS